jgi:NAD(P)-dependent dehydrogenase (short-subunit alcohol dehydrogenase family)
VRVIGRDHEPGSLEDFESIVRVNLTGTFNVLRHAASAMMLLDPIGEERGVFVLTSSIAAFEGQIGQLAYAASKAGVVGLTLTAARELASKQIRVCTIAPGVFDTPILDRLGDTLKTSLAAGIPHPSRLGRPDEFADLAMHIVENPMLNGETIRLDGAIRLAPR